MTQVYDGELPDATPQTHVLAIGVGRYRHLFGGPKENSGDHIVDILPLGQLTSPPISASAFAGWFTGGVSGDLAPPPGSRLGAPLGSVELLISAADGQAFTPAPGRPAIPVAPADFANVQTAFNAWEGRCTKNPNNIAIFYFCGHGLQRETTLLLPEDFGANPNNVWLTTIDFDKTYRGMAGCAAETQYYIVDACRQWTDDMLRHLDMNGAPLKTPRIDKQNPRTAPKLFATANGLPAFGDTGGISRLTQALLAALNGGGADKRGGQWLVDTDQLGNAVQKLVSLRNKALRREQQQIVDSGGGERSLGARVLHVVSEVPTVLVPLCCLPEEATTSGLFYWIQEGAKVVAPAAGAWETTLKAGIYDFGVSFANGAFPEKVLSKETIRPPVWPLALEVG